MVKNGDSTQVILSGFGMFLGKKSERLIVRQVDKGNKTIYEFPFFRLTEITIASHAGVSISADLIFETCRRGIRIQFMTPTGQPYAMLTSPMLTATTATRREQIMAYNDERGALFSRIIVEAKIRNQEKLLRYFNKYLRRNDPRSAEKIDAIAGNLARIRKRVPVISKGIDIDRIRGELMGIEGSAGRVYWKGVAEIIAKKTEFLGRAHRGAQDEVNSLLNYGYGILYTHVWGAVLNAGLEPFAGFLHVDRPGKPSIVLDLTEEFRQPVVDREVLAFINLGQEVAMEGGVLSSKTRQAISQKILDRFESYERYKGKRYQIKSIIQLQARNLAKFLRGEERYSPFRFKW